ncbi:MAG: hypothetical protein C4330_12745 [Chitinophagaceae bacterium]
MENDQTKKESYDYRTDQPLAKNDNARANENIRVRTEEPIKQNTETTEEVDSEISDGEDA